MLLASTWFAPFTPTDPIPWTISTEGGNRPRWSGDGGALYYRDPAGSIVRAEIATAPVFKTGKVARVADSGGATLWDVTRDGRVLTAIRAAQPAAPAVSSPITVILNWPSLLEDRRASH
jgi:hypothetical protein